MNDDRKTKQQLIKELAALRQRISLMEEAEASHQQNDTALGEREELYRTLIETSPDPIIVYNLEGQINTANTQAAMVYGVSSTAEFLREVKTCFDLLSNDGKALPAANFGHTLAEGSAKPRECLLRNREGRMIAVEIHSSAIQTITGEPRAFISVIKDITERKQEAENLRRAEDNYRSIFENAQEGIFRSTPEGKFIVANQAMARILGYESPEELMESVTDIKDQLHVNPEEHIKAIEQVEHQGFAKNNELQFYRKDRQKIWVSRTMRGLRNKKGMLLYIDGIIEDITDRKNSTDQLRKALGGTVQAIALLVEKRDPYTAGHQRRVADIARTIAQEMGLSDEQVNGLRMAGIIHDIGKVSVPAEILSSPRKLSNIEFSMIKTHAQSGYDIMKDIEFPWPIARMILEHHERMNGSGYPNGLTGDNILIESRILSVADVVEAMATHRPYRASLGIDAALEEIARNRGALYDPDAVDACLSIFKEQGYKIKE